jgi:hypothetical protein
MELFPHRSRLIPLNSVGLPLLSQPAVDFIDPLFQPIPSFLVFIRFPSFYPPYLPP